MSDLQDLIARVEAGEGADRGLDSDVAKALGFGILIDLPTYTTSLDAVMALANGRAFTVGQNVHHLHWVASVNALDEDGSPYSLGCSNAAKSAPRALLAAILRAKAGV